jgi:hypothetical protein
VGQGDDRRAFKTPTTASRRFGPCHTWRRATASCQAWSRRTEGARSEAVPCRSQSAVTPPARAIRSSSALQGVRPCSQVTTVFRENPAASPKAPWDSPRPRRTEAMRWAPARRAVPPDHDDGALRRDRQGDAVQGQAEMRARAEQHGILLRALVAADATGQGAQAYPVPARQDDGPEVPRRPPGRFNPGSVVFAGRLPADSRSPPIRHEPCAQVPVGWYRR